MELSLVQGLSLEEISHVIALATAPAFLIAATVSFLTISAGRLSRIFDRARALVEIGEQDKKHAHLKADIPYLRRRARLIHFSMLFAMFSGIMTGTLVIIAFLGDLLNYTLEQFIAVLFICAIA